MSSFMLGKCRILVDCVFGTIKIVNNISYGLWWISQELTSLFLGAKEKTFSHWAAVESFFGLQTRENPLIKFREARPRETFVRSCIVWEQHWAKESVMAVCLLISGQFLLPLLCFCWVFFLKHSRERLVEGLVVCWILHVPWNRLSQKYLSGFVSPQSSWHNLRDAEWILSIWGEEESAHCPILSLGVNQTISIILERFPWC